MQSVPGETLWLGHAGDVRNVRHLLDVGIAAIVDLAANEPLPTLPRDLIYCRFPLVDAAINRKALLRLAVQTTTTLLRSQTATLVCCSNGLSRSPAVAAVALAMLHQEEPTLWLQKISEIKPLDVLPGLWEELRHLNEK
jgi:hypothetical protein